MTIEKGDWVQWEHPNTGKIEISEVTNISVGSVYIEGGYDIGNEAILAIRPKGTCRIVQKETAVDDVLPLDAMVDSFTFATNPYGMIIKFAQSQENNALPRSVSTIRVSFEHAKAMVYILKRMIIAQEAQVQRQYPIAADVLVAMGTNDHDWQAFWRTA